MSDSISFTRLILIRHGESQDNVAGRLSGWTDSPLTHHGQSQARRAARFVSEQFRPSALYVSPLTRAVQTAQPLAESTGLTPRRRDDLRELHFGVADGLTFAEIEARHAGLLQRASQEDDAAFGWPGGESRRNFWERVLGAIEEIGRAHRGETVAIVSHGGVLSTFLAYAAAGNPTRWRDYPLHNCALSETHADSHGVAVIRWNVVDHLGE